MLFLCIIVWVGWEIAKAGADSERGHNVSFFFCNSRAKGINGYFGWIKNPLFSSLTRIRLHTQGYFPNHWANIMLFPLMFINCFTVTPWHCFATHTTRLKNHKQKYNCNFKLNIQSGYHRNLILRSVMEDKLSLSTPRNRIPLQLTASK